MLFLLVLGSSVNIEDFDSYCSVVTVIFVILNLCLNNCLEYLNGKNELLVVHLWSENNDF